MKKIYLYILIVLGLPAAGVFLIKDKGEDIQATELDDKASIGALFLKRVDYNFLSRMNGESFKVLEKLKKKRLLEEYPQVLKNFAANATNKEVPYYIDIIENYYQDPPVNSKYNLIPTVLESLAIMGRNGVDSAENFLVNKFFSKEFFKGLKYKYFTQEMIDRQKNIPYEELALKNFYYQLKSKISEKAFIAIHLKLKAQGLQFSENYILNKQNDRYIKSKLVNIPKEKMQLAYDSYYKHIFLFEEFIEIDSSFKEYSKILFGAEKAYATINDRLIRNVNMVQCFYIEDQFVTKCPRGTTLRYLLKIRAVIKDEFQNFKVDSKHVYMTLNKDRKTKNRFPYNFKVVLKIKGAKKLIEALKGENENPVTFEGDILKFTVYENGDYFWVPYGY